MINRRAFTLVELLVVVGIIAVLMSVLIPVLGKARRAANAAKCLSNVRSMQIAHWLYASENRGWIIQAGMSHGGHQVNEQGGWFTTLQKYYQSRLLLRCPADDSPSWDAPPTPGSQLRRTSYGINNFLDRELVPWGGPYGKINQISKPSFTIQFVEMAYTGEFSVADHPHIENWTGMNVPAIAAKHLQINSHGGPPRDWSGVSTYGFVDGHAEQLPLRAVFTNLQRNRFDPAIAQ